ncbi:vascular endothelial growth factor receptor 2-like [Ptychodera flava]|uniref:vascular endothelial growth factor receptor 2-like n=1 Tax=Ptychodera flava TaxID=63121 RepID=UPI00396A06AB
MAALISLTAPVILIETSTAVEALLGDVVDLVCTVDGFPTPIVIWFDNKDEVISGSEENKNVTTVIDDVETVTSTLTVSVVNESYYGIYTCEASNRIPPTVKQEIHIIEPGSHSDIIAISVTCTVIFVVLMVGIVLGVLFYKKRVAKDQSSNTDYANAGLDTSDYAEIPENNSSNRQETGLSEAIDIDPF